MKLEALTGYGCRLSPHCQPDMENVALLNQILVYGIAGVSVVVATIMLVIFIILAVRKAVAKARRLLGIA